MYWVFCIKHEAPQIKKAQILPSIEPAFTVDIYLNNLSFGVWGFQAQKKPQPDNQPRDLDNLYCY